MFRADPQLLTTQVGLPLLDQLRTHMKTYPTAASLPFSLSPVFEILCSKFILKHLLKASTSVSFSVSKSILHIL